MLWILLGLGSAVFHALHSILSKKTMAHEHALEFGATQGLYMLLFVFLLPFINLHYSWQTYASLVIISIVFSAGNLYYLKSIRHSELSSAIPLMNISPLFLLLLAFAFLGEQPSFIDILGVLLLITGTYVLQIGTSKKNLWTPFKTLIYSKYSLYMIFAMLIFSFATTMEKHVINNGIDVLSLLVILRLMIGGIYVGVASYKHGFSEIWADARKDGKTIFLGVMFSFISMLFFYSALAVPGALVSLVIPVKRTSTFITALVGGTLFHEHNLGLKLFACAIMIGGIALVAL